MSERDREREIIKGKKKHETRDQKQKSRCKEKQENVYILNRQSRTTGVDKLN